MSKHSQGKVFFYNHNLCDKFVLVQSFRKKDDLYSATHNVLTDY